MLIFAALPQESILGFQLRVLRPELGALAGTPMFGQLSVLAFPFTVARTAPDHGAVEPGAECPMDGPLRVGGPACVTAFVCESRNAL